MLSVYDHMGVALCFPWDLLENTFGEVHLSDVLELEQVHLGLDIEMSDNIYIMEDAIVFVPEGNIPLRKGLSIYFKREEESGDIAKSDGWTMYYMGQPGRPPKNKEFPCHFGAGEDPIVMYVNNKDLHDTVSITKETAKTYECFVISAAQRDDYSKEPFLRLRDAMEEAERIISNGV